MVGYIYVIEDTRSAKIVYVGQTRQRPSDRWAQHRQRDTPLAKTLRAEGVHNFSFRVIETVPKAALNEREIHWIAVYSTMHPHGLNHRPGGRAKGTSARAKQKLSAASKAMWGSTEYREKEKARRKQLWEDPEHKAKMSAIRKAMWQDPAFRERMRRTHKDAWQNEGRREQHGEMMRGKWADEEYKQKVSASISQAVSGSEKFLAAQSGRARKRYQVPAAV